MNTNGSGTTTNGTALTPSEQRVVNALTRHLDERLAVQRRILEDRLLTILSDRVSELRLEIEEALVEVEDAMLDEDDDDEDEDDQDHEKRRRT
jgi:hypothetical protein